MNPIVRYARWLHTRWPAGTVEKMPEVGDDGMSSVRGLAIVGDLTGIPLLKFSADTGARAVRAMLEAEAFEASTDDPVWDLAIIGGGVSGLSAALEAKKHGVHFVWFEAAEHFNTVVNFPKGKPIYTYPTDMIPAGELRLTATVKEELLEELEAQRVEAGIEAVLAHIERVRRVGSSFELEHSNKTAMTTKARRVIIAIGRSGNYRRLGAPGQDLDKVYHRLYDPMEYAGKNALVVGGGDSALESAIALATCGAKVTLSYRKAELSRAKPENVQKAKQLEADPTAEVGVESPVSDRVNSAASFVTRGDAAAGSLNLWLGSKLEEIRETEAVITDADGVRQTLPNDVVFAMIGREAPLDFFRRSGVKIRGEWRAHSYISFAMFISAMFFVYNWKSGGSLTQLFEAYRFFPFNMPGLVRSVAVSASTPSNLLGTLAATLGEPGFYYSLAYSSCVVVFGIDRVRRRQTAYVRVQTAALMAVQLIPLFLLPYIVLPWLGHNGVFDSGFGRTVADNLFPAVGYGHGREYWRAFGFVLAWPLFIWNFFTEAPMTWWLVIGGIQTFVIIPLMIRRWGKGAYCGWICSCGALAETLGDRHRGKMPHGPIWNRLNMVGQLILLLVFVLFFARALSWTFPETSWGAGIGSFYRAALSGFELFGVPLNYYKLVDVFLAGIVGVGCYFWFSGRVWCRFACPLAALMHIYSRMFSRFRIFAEKKKCISCNLCTSVCHQGIDIMNFANKGLPMEDPECVRCSACVQTCPTGTLAFGRYRADGTIAFDALVASAVRAKEARG